MIKLQKIHQHWQMWAENNIAGLPIGKKENIIKMYLSPLLLGLHTRLFTCTAYSTYFITESVSIWSVLFLLIWPYCSKLEVKIMRLECWLWALKVFGDDYWVSSVRVIAHLPLGCVCKKDCIFHTVHWILMETPLNLKVITIAFCTLFDLLALYVLYIHSV